MRRIIARFRDVEDVVNHHPQTRTFLSPIWRPDRPDEKQSAIQWLQDTVKKEGFTSKELLRVKEVEIKL